MRSQHCAFIVFGTPSYEMPFGYDRRYWHTDSAFQKTHCIVLKYSESSPENVLDEGEKHVISFSPSLSFCRSKTYDPSFCKEAEREATSIQHRNSVPNVSRAGEECGKRKMYSKGVQFIL